MGNLLTKNELLHEMLQLLVRSHGKAAVLSALENLDRVPELRRRTKRRGKASEEPDALKFVERMLPLPNGDLLRHFADDYDRGLALPKSSDIRRFLVDHRVKPEDLKGRNQAFRRIFPVLRTMSEKGLLRLIDRARFSGPAQLDEISDAIKGTGNEIRRLRLD